MTEKKTTPRLNLHRLNARVDDELGEIRTQIAMLTEAVQALTAATKPDEHTPVRVVSMKLPIDLADRYRDALTWAKAEGMTARDFQTRLLVAGLDALDNDE